MELCDDLTGCIPVRVVEQGGTGCFGGITQAITGFTGAPLGFEFTNNNTVYRAKQVSDDPRSRRSGRAEFGRGARVLFDLTGSTFTLLDTTFFGDPRRYQQSTGSRIDDDSGRQERRVVV